MGHWRLLLSNKKEQIVDLRTSLDGYQGHCTHAKKATYGMVPFIWLSEWQNYRDERQITGSQASGMVCKEEGGWSDSKGVAEGNLCGDGLVSVMGVQWSDTSDKMAQNYIRWCQCQFPGFDVILEETGWRVRRTTLYCLCNFLWMYSYLKPKGQKNKNKKEMVVMRASSGETPLQ